MTGGEEAALLARVPEPLLDWYRQNARVLPWRSQPTPYRVWVSEIMLQQTRVEAAKPYFLRFVEALPDARALADCPEEQLMKLWEGLGYYSRARNLQKAALVVAERYGGELPASFEALRELPGIGDYTAGAIASIAFGLPCPAVDGNVLRVLSRVTGSRRDIADPKVKKEMGEAIRAILPPCPGDFNQALMELGATVCLPNGDPLCGECPLGGFCRARALGIQGELPVKAPKKPRAVQALTVFLLRSPAGKTAIRRRPAGGLLGGMWELPNLPGSLSRDEARDWLERRGAKVLSLEPLPPAKHIFTHVEWRMTVWEARLDREPSPGAGLVWVTREELDHGYALPSAFRAAGWGRPGRGPQPAQGESGGLEPSTKPVAGQAGAPLHSLSP